MVLVSVEAHYSSHCTDNVGKMQLEAIRLFQTISLFWF